MVTVCVTMLPDTCYQVNGSQHDAAMSLSRLPIAVEMVRPKMPLTVLFFANEFRDKHAHTVRKDHPS